MGFNDVNQMLSSRGLPSSKFENPGETKVGVLKDVDIQDVTNTEGVVQYQKDGVTPKKQIVITWQTDERDPANEGDTGLRKLYCSWRLERAIRDAFREAGAEGLEENAKLTVTLLGTEKVQVPNSKMQVNAKTYSAVYERPSKTFASSSTPEATTAAQSDWAPNDADVKVALAMFNSGVTDLGIISKATNIPEDYLRREVLSF